MGFEYLNFSLKNLVEFEVIVKTAKRKLNEVKGLLNWAFEDEAM